jgi:hypothetical protein
MQRKQPEMKFSVEDDHVYLSEMKSTGPGSGTEGMRSLVELSFKNGFGGNIKLEATFSSHIFHLYMGMIPDDNHADYVQYVYGLEGQFVLENLGNCTKVTDLQSFSRKHCLIKILAEEKQISRELITDEMIWENKQFLIDLDKKTLAYTQMIFVPKLLSILGRNIGTKKPDTASLGNVRMIISEEGKARWKRVIEQGETFEPFRDFSQLRTRMTKEQIEELERILLQNPQAQQHMEAMKEEKPNEALKTRTSEENQSISWSKRVGRVLSVMINSVGSGFKWFVTKLIPCWRGCDEKQVPEITKKQPEEQSAVNSPRHNSFMYQTLGVGKSATVEYPVVQTDAVVTVEPSGFFGQSIPSDYLPLLGCKR